MSTIWYTSHRANAKPGHTLRRRVSARIIRRTCAAKLTLAAIRIAHSFQKSTVRVNHVFSIGLARSLSMDAHKK